MASELDGIARLGGLASTAATTAAPAPVTGFVTTVQRPGPATPFETVVQRAAVEQTARARKAAPAAASAPTAVGSPLATAKQAAAAKAQKSFESFALQTFIGSMLPKENAKLFGTGSAGKMWQSILAEKLAEQITASGRLKLLPEQTGAAGTIAPQTAEPASAAVPLVKSNGLQAGIARQDLAGGKTPAALQELLGSLQPDRSGGTR